MFRQRFETVSDFIRECHEKRGLSTALFHFVLQEQDHEILDECVRILLRTGRWDTTQVDKIHNYTTPAQYPFQDEAFALALGINQGYKPSTPEYPLCLFFQHGNPLMLDIYYILRSNHITTVEQYNELIANSPIRLLHKTLLTTTSKHHYTKIEIDLWLYAEFLCRLLGDEKESFHHWCKIDSTQESILSEFSDLYPQFHELQLNKLSRYRILTAIWSLPHPRLFAMISANRADSIINRTQLLILLEKRHLPHIMSLLYTLTMHIDNAKKSSGFEEIGVGMKNDQEMDMIARLQKYQKERQLSLSSTSSPDNSDDNSNTTLTTPLPSPKPLTDYIDYSKQTYWVELEPTLGVTTLLPSNYLNSFNAGCSSNPLNGGQIIFSSYQEEVEYLECYLNSFQELVALVWSQYTWIDLPSSLQVSIIVLLQFAPQVLSFLPWIPDLHGQDDIIIDFDKFLVDQLKILRWNDDNINDHLTTRKATSPSSPNPDSRNTDNTNDEDDDDEDNDQDILVKGTKKNKSGDRIETFQFTFTPSIIEPFKNDMVQVLHDNRRWIMPVINTDLYGSDIIVVAPEFKQEILSISASSTSSLSDSNSSASLQKMTTKLSQFSEKITNFELIHSTATRSPSHLDELTISSPTAPSPRASISSDEDIITPLAQSSQSLDFCQVEEEEVTPNPEKENVEKVETMNEGDKKDEEDTTTLTISTDTREDTTTTSPTSPKDINSDDEKNRKKTKDQKDFIANDLSSSSSDFLKSCLPLDQKNRRTKRTVKFMETIYETNDQRPMVRDGKTLGHDDDLIKHTSHQSHFDTKLRSSMLRFALVFAVSANMTHVIDWVIQASNGRSLNDLMTIEGQKQPQQQGYRTEPKINFFDNLIAAACHVPHCHPSTVQYLFKRRSKLCTNNKTGRDNNAFLVLYQTEQHWLYQHHRYAKLLTLWLQVKQNERVYKPHLDFNEFITATINQIYVQSSSYWCFTFFLEHLLSVAERTLIKQNAIRVCDILACLYNPPHSTNFSTTSIIPNTTRFLGPPGSQQGLSRQNCAYPSDLTVADLDIILPPIINYTEYTTGQQQTIPKGINNNNNNNNLVSPPPTISSYPTTLPQYTPIISPPLETYLEQTTSLKDAYHQYECAQRGPYLYFFINNQTVSLFLPPSQEYVVTEEYPSELFTPSPTSIQSPTSSQDDDMKEGNEDDEDNNNEVEQEDDSSSSSSSSSSSQLGGATPPTISLPPSGLKSPGSVKNQEKGKMVGAMNKKDTVHPRNQPLNVQLFYRTQQTLSEVNRVSALLMKLKDPLGYNGLPNNNNDDDLQHKIIENYQKSLKSNGDDDDASMTSNATTSTAMTNNSTPVLPSFLLGNNNYLTPPRGQQRDNLQQLMFPFLEFRDLNAIRYLFDLGISTKSMWQRLLSLHHVFFDVKDIVDYIPTDLYSNRHNYQISGLRSTNLINENPWLTLGTELQRDIIDKKMDPIVNPLNPTQMTLALPNSQKLSNSNRITSTVNVNSGSDDDDSDVDYSNLPPLEDISTLIKQGVNPEDLFGATAHRNPTVEPPAPLVFESQNKNPFLTRQFLTTKHKSPMLQMLQLFLLYDNSLFEHSISHGPRNLATTACLSFNWPIVQALYITNTDTFVPQSDLSKYQNAVYCYPERLKSTDDVILPHQPDATPVPIMIDVGADGMGLTQAVNMKHSLNNQHKKQIQGKFKEYHYDLDIAASYKHDLLSILGSDILNTNNNRNSTMKKRIDIKDENMLAQIAPHLPPRVFKKLTDPFLSTIRSEAITPDFTPSFHVDYLHLLLMFLLPQRNLNPITNYFSMMLFELIFSHVLRDYLIFDTTQREELLIYLRRSLVVHSFLPQTEKSLYEGPVENIVKIVLQHSKDILMRQARFKEQAFVNSIKSLYKYHILFTTTKPKQGEYLFLFSQTHLLHPALVYDTFHAFVKFGGNYQKPLPLLQYSILEFFQQHITSSSSQSTQQQQQQGADDDDNGQNDKFLHIVRQFFPNFQTPQQLTGPPSTSSGSE